MEYKKVKPYQIVSEIYAHLMHFIKYEEWAEYYYNITKDNLPDNARVLELAGGNAKLAVCMMEYFKDVITSDLSYNMLAQSTDNRLKRVCCNMEHLPFNGKFDLIFSAFDSINYLITKKSLSRTFQGVRCLLSDEGFFSFDVSLENNSINNVLFLNRKGIYKGINYEQKSVYDKEKRMHYNKFQFTLEDGSSYIETHKQKIFPIEVYFELLVTNGFIVKQCYDSFSLNDASQDSQRVQFVAIKDKSNA
ncbi:MAG: methyltransferase domain-containing protein [Ignavibacteria bacterium]